MCQHSTWQHSWPLRQPNAAAQAHMSVKRTQQTGAHTAGYISMHASIPHALARACKSSPRFRRPSLQAPATATCSSHAAGDPQHTMAVYLLSSRSRLATRPHQSTPCCIQMQPCNPNQPKQHGMQSAQDQPQIACALVHIAVLTPGSTLQPAMIRPHKQCNHPTTFALVATAASSPAILA